MKPVAVYPDAELLTVDLLKGVLAPHEPQVGVGIALPADWPSGSGEYMQVAWDGTPSAAHPVAIRPTLRVTAFAASTSRAKRLATVGQALLLAHAGGNGVTSFKYLTGPLPADDPDTGSPIASFTVRATVRSQGL